MGSGGRWKEGLAWGSRDWVLCTVAVSEEGVDCLGFPKMDFWANLAKTEGEEEGTVGCGDETGTLTSVLSSSSGEESSPSLVRVVQIVPSVGFLLM